MLMSFYKTKQLPHGAPIILGAGGGRSWGFKGAVRGNEGFPTVTTGASTLRYLRLATKIYFFVNVAHEVALRVRNQLALAIRRLGLYTL